MEEIKAGDIVQLKSGGPAMTVVWAEKSEVYCNWFSAHEKMEAKFERIVLQPYKK